MTATMQEAPVRSLDMLPDAAVKAIIAGTLQKYRVEYDVVVEASSLEEAEGLAASLAQSAEAADSHVLSFDVAVVIEKRA